MVAANGLVYQLAGDFLFNHGTANLLFPKVRYLVLKSIVMGRDFFVALRTIAQEAKGFRIMMRDYKSRTAGYC